MVEGTEWSRADAAAFLRVPTSRDDKYSRGVVGLRTGSERYPGAAVLGVEGAWRAGAGMVRYVGPARDLVLARRPETVAVDGRVQAWVIGSGTDAAVRAPAETEALRALLAGEVPVVVDAGALDLASAAAAPIVVTPHAGEHRLLRERLGLPVSPGVPGGAARGGTDRAESDGGGADRVEVAQAEADRAEAALGTARALGATVLLKGATTVVASPDGRVRTVTAPTSWLATAGTGDVLAGVLGALVAAGGDLPGAAATAAWIHGRAGAAASAARGGGPLVALEVAEHVASVVGGLLTGSAEGAGRPTP
ncbi:ADP-dependent NAD(P)H-hydrate dehydratase [Microbacterium sp. No. 7]|uniref:ADP-dependent NAD(P)H-hydrate dehydratase n=1 Tax=Microbacterium sp. No. 7 TaxID=1714373 RepID=UPI0006D0BDBD|nr:ADP/ATP-dependent (S)-NAD(P)H-hydrate dehydratase [Microbacterium sp. No. 7]ALJ21248.1 hypothetical protein AOA12_15605 [Microbacterium sp. No. 7]